MSALSLLLSILPAFGAYVALSIALAHFRRREWQHAAGMMIVGLILAFGAVALIEKGIGG